MLILLLLENIQGSRVCLMIRVWTKMRFMRPILPMLFLSLGIFVLWINETNFLTKFQLLIPIGPKGTQSPPPLKKSIWDRGGVGGRYCTLLFSKNLLKNRNYFSQKFEKRENISNFRKDALLRQRFAVEPGRISGGQQSGRGNIPWFAHTHTNEKSLEQLTRNA